MEVKNKVFVDSNYFIALYNLLDSTHLKARSLSKSIGKRNAKLVISNYIFSEVLTVLSQKVSKRAAVLMGKRLLDNKDIDIVHIDENLQTVSWKIFQKIRNKNISFVDCSILAVMEEFGIKQLLTFDLKDFLRLKKKFKFRLF